MENPEKIEIEGLKTIHKLCKFGADHNMEGCTFTEIVERMFSKIEQMKTQINTLDEMLLNQGEALAQAKAQAVPEWINVNLLSPQVDTEVLVCVGDDVKTAIYRDLDGEGYFEGVFGAKWWMPKPKAQEPAND